MKRSIQSRLFRSITTWLGIAFLIQLFIFSSYELMEIFVEGASWEEESHEMMLLFGLDIATFPILAGIIWSRCRKLIGPLHTVAASAERISKGELDHRISGPLPDDEIGTVANAVNNAFDRYNTVLDRMAQFSSDASHQLRTPLTGLRVTGEVSLNSDRPPEEYRETIASMLEEIQRITRIVEQLLALSRMKDGEIKRNYAEVDLATLLVETVDRFQDALDARNIQFSMHADKPSLIQGDRELIAETFSNILDNALVITPEGGTVEVRIENSDPDQVQVVVADSGPGIHPKDRERIFHRFNRLPGAMHPGSGLGLAIASDVVALHDGSISVDESPDGGARFVMRFPQSGLQVKSSIAHKNLKSHET